MTNEIIKLTKQNIADIQQQLIDQIPSAGADILEYAQKLEHSQVLGFQTLIYLAAREQTSIAYQHKEMGFSDIPLNLILSTDALSEEEQLYLAAQLADEIFEDSVMFNAAGSD